MPDGGRGLCRPASRAPCARRASASPSARPVGADCRGDRARVVVPRSGSRPPAPALPAGAVRAAHRRSRGRGDRRRRELPGPHRAAGRVASADLRHGPGQRGDDRLELARTADRRGPEGQMDHPGQQRPVVRQDGDRRSRLPGRRAAVRCHGPEREPPGRSRWDRPDGRWITRRRCADRLLP